MTEQVVSTPRSSDSPKVISVSASALLGEAPYWYEPLNSLLYVDMMGSQIRRLRHADKQGEAIVNIGYPGLFAVSHLFHFNTGKAVSFIIPVMDAEDQFVMAQGDKVVLATWDGASQSPKSPEILASVGKGRKNVITVGKADPRGRLWIGTSDSVVHESISDSKIGSLYSLRPGREVKRHLQNLGGCSGLEWSLDGATLFFVEAFTGTVDAFDYDVENGELSNRRIVFDFKDKVRGEPRGLAVDEEGKLWVAAFGGSQVARVDPQTGVLMKQLPVPARDVTNVAFGGEDYADLYVTSGAWRLDSGERGAFPGAGTTFRVAHLGVGGRPARAAAL